MLFTKNQLQGVLEVIRDLSGGSASEIAKECNFRNIIHNSTFVEYMIDIHLIPMGYVKDFHLEQTRYNISQVGEMHLASLCEL